MSVNTSTHQTKLMHLIRFKNISFTLLALLSSGNSVVGQAAVVLPVVPAGLNKKYALVTKPEHTATAIYTGEMVVPRLKPKEWLIFAAKPGNTPGQRVVSIDCTPATQVVRDQSPLHRDLFCARVPVTGAKNSSSIQFKMQIQVELFSRSLVSRRGKAPDIKITVNDRSNALRRTKLFDYASPTIQKWMETNKLHRKSREGEVDFARRVFQQIVKQSTYEYLGNQNRSSSHVCSSKKSDCGGLSILFASALRSQGVPARIRVGRWAQSAKAGEKVGSIIYHQEHVKAEFFAQGVGWVPADLSSAVLHDKTRKKLNYFGKDVGDFITLHHDTEISYDTVHFGIKTMDFLQKPAFWATGSGDFNGNSVKESWTVVKRAVKR